MGTTATNQLKTEAGFHKKNVIGRLHSGTRAYSVFMLYRVAANPRLAIPPIKYLNHFCDLADSKRNLPFP